MKMNLEILVQLSLLDKFFKMVEWNQAKIYIEKQTMGI